MGFIKKFLSLFKKKENQEKNEKKLEKNLNYNPKLINDLKEDHKSLFELYNEIVKIYKNNPNNFKMLSEKLHDFKIALEVHLMVEDTQLYSYLETKYNDEFHKKFIKDLEHEMDIIAKEVINFIRKYSDYQMFKNYQKNFINDAQNIAKVLTKRVDIEEKRLYKLYIP